MISILCETFHCTPAEALEQDPALVRAIIDYRRLVAFEAGGDNPDRVVDYDEMEFYEEVRRLAYE